MQGMEVMISLLCQPSLTKLSAPGCGQLQLGAPHSATSVALLQVFVVVRPHMLWY